MEIKNMTTESNEMKLNEREGRLGKEYDDEWGQNVKDVQVKHSKQKQRKVFKY